MFPVYTDFVNRFHEAGFSPDLWAEARPIGKSLEALVMAARGKPRA
jgi:hypothetical protein